MRLALAAALLLAAAPAAAYPYYQLTSGTDACGTCHVSPSGGGPLSEWGRGEVGDTLARGGDGAFLHGLVALPAWLDVGGDLRLAALVDDTGAADGAEHAVFPMQAELSVHAAHGPWHLVADAGALGPVRADQPDPAMSVEPPPAAPWLVSSAHYLLWRPGERGPYARAGKLNVPYGLRLADHTAYVRRQLGFTPYAEPYAVSGGYLGARWDVHATAFVSDPWRGSADREVGAALLAEHRHGPWVATASTMLVDGSDDRRLRAGTGGARWIERASLYAMAEVDGGWQSLAGGGRPQLTGYGGLAWLPLRGLVIGGAGEYDDVDLGRSGDTRTAADLWATFMPIAHVELGLASRYQWIGSDARAAMALFQVHYFL